MESYLQMRMGRQELIILVAWVLMLLSLMDTSTVLFLFQVIQV